MRVRFLSLASGSSGNCYYLGTETCGILIDAGISVRAIKTILKDAGINMDTIRAVFITHDHVDHIRGVGGLGEKMHIPIYATRLIHKGINNSFCITKKFQYSANLLEKGETVHLGDFLIEPFEVPHDGTDNVGYFIRAGEKNFVFITDLGEIPPHVAEYIRKANYLVMEANYDEEMLRVGNYPVFLKERISSCTGHLSNTVTAEFLAENFSAHLRNVWLCHLSKENNHPELAYKTVETALRQRGITVGKELQLCVLKRTTPSDLYEFE